MLKDILAISGKPGLFKFISQGRNGIIVESLEDGKRMNAFASVKMSSLEDIAIYTNEEELPLAEVFKKINEKEGERECISHKSSPDELKNYFQTILPDYDEERVYVSDIKKVMQWYNLLLGYKMLNFEEEEKKEIKTEKGDDKKSDDAEKKKAEAKKTGKVETKKQPIKKPGKTDPKSTAPKKTAKPIAKTTGKKTTNK